ncbi:LEAF RUST 10 DISEASE-RESISTANCE LOCUS RECEPTOR-LIKE PROTEIN KINASE-like 2.1 [Ricinus communis]|uniref:LEAF RUST 10 DISEASE-RESISTANCE LOCUS RECEPTOR-LIKE PROTEIN KINASE-like 2.1 n=1 Tax=Ricinus communis TaxID=3988 RepID=UPI00201AE139|nr:LEAF RUST 10 DISEASE-RESISTANCE LOCUS RECEPTOR-LIKE PROTEIN KINASE-like 2.1 [Ricinus communis]
MIVHFFLPSHVHSIIIITLFFLLVFVSISYCEDDENYTDCRKPFSCGNLTDLYYPFWSDERSRVCGYEGFKLECEEGQLPNITIRGEEFRVISVNHNQSTMAIARADYWANACTQNFADIILNETLFNYTQHIQNLSLYYNCEIETLSKIPPEKRLPCSSANGESLNAFYATDELLEEWGLLNRYECLNTVKIPVPVDTLGEIWRGVDALERVLRQGFNVSYRIQQECVPCVASGGICGTNTTTFNFTCLCRDQPHDSWCSGHHDDDPNLKMKVGIGIVPVSVVVLLVIIFCLCLRRDCWKNQTKESESIEAFLKNHGPMALKRYRYTEVKKMTQSFKDKLGQGGYGGVFKGKLPDGHDVAVKVLKESNSNGEEFVNEVASISRTSHVNIVTLLGFCYEGSKRALIYEFMSNGSLEKYIYKEKYLRANRELEWKTLYEIAIGIAQGLEYLHRGCNTRILHFDIKPHNILLDQEFCPKISDFGLAKICHGRESIISMVGARGTVGYIAPEVFCREFGGVSYKSDVYSYGMLVLGMAGARNNICVEVDSTSEIYFPDWIYKRLEIDEELGLCGIDNEEENQIARKLILVSLWCIQTNPKNRPPMDRVVKMLQGSVASLSIPPRPSWHSPSRSPPELVADSSTTIEFNNVVLTSN